MRRALTLILALLCCVAAPAQDKLPMLSAFKENYFITGSPVNAKPDFDTNDVAFQVSMRFNAFQDIKGSGWDVFAGFTEMSLWDAYKPSNPFRSNTYMAGLYAWYPFRRSGDTVKSDVLFGFEHRSNGRDSHSSREMNYAFCTLTHTFGSHLTIQATGRFGQSSVGNDHTLDMYRYQGYANLGVLYCTVNRRLMMSVSVTPIFMDIPCNLSAELAFRPMPDNDWFYLTVRYHYGYDENQLDCAMPDVFLKQMVRFGFSIQPRLLSHKLFF